MESFQLNNYVITTEKQFPKDIVRERFPLRYGKCSIIKTPEYEFLFNLNGEVKFIRGLNLKNWPHSAEQMKRTDGNDWVYYSVVDDSSHKGVIPVAVEGQPQCSDPRYMADIKPPPKAANFYKQSRNFVGKTRKAIP